MLPKGSTAPRGVEKELSADAAARSSSAHAAAFAPELAATAFARTTSVAFFAWRVDDTSHSLVVAVRMELSYSCLSD